MRTFSFARAALAVAVVALSIMVPAGPALAGPEDAVYMEPTYPQTVRVGPGSAAPKQAQIELHNFATEAHDIVAIFDAGGAPAAFTVVLPGADQGCTVTGAVSRCPLPGMAPSASHKYTFGVAAAPGAPATATGVVQVSATSDGVLQQMTGTFNLVLGAADVDLVLAPLGTWKLNPGDVVDLPIRVRNDGGTTAPGVYVRLRTGSGDPSLDMVQLMNVYGNCSDDPFQRDVTCRFDTPVAPGETFEIDPATPLRARVNPVAPGNNSYGGQATVDASDPRSLRSAGPVARLRKAAAARSSDLNPYDNSQYFSFHVEKLQPAEGSAIGASVAGKIGETKTVTVGFRNDGPAAMAAREGGGRDALVRLPAGLKVTRMYEGCERTETAEGKRWLEFNCHTGGFILPGKVDWIWFDVKIVARPGKAGSIRIHSGAQDRNPANDVAPLVLVVPGSETGSGNGSGSGSGGAGGGGGLPITGAPSGTIAGFGAMLVGLGVAILLLTRRRPENP